MSFKDVKEYIPHREPFLFVDQILTLESNQITTQFTFRPELEFYKGHYPNHPITPGVITSEAVFQSAAILISSLINDAVKISKGTPVLTRITNAKFKGMVKPKDTIEMVVHIVEHLQNTWFLKGKVSLLGKTILNIEFAVSLIGEPS